MKALDLFCGAGGASEGLRRAGFEVTGVDLSDRVFAGNPALTSLFQADAIEWVGWHDLSRYDLIWASPPCQAFTAYKRRPDHVAPKANLIPKVRELLRASGVPYIIENVPGAPLENPVTLCGSMFGLDVRRHREFECGFPVVPPTCNHGWQTPRFPPATNRTNLRSTVDVAVWRIPLRTQQLAMGIDWMSREELSQAIPPAYAEFLARQFLMGKERTA